MAKARRRSDGVKTRAKAVAGGEGGDKEGAAAGRPVKLTVKVSEPAWRQLKNLAMDERSSIQEVVVRAINRLFLELGKPEIA